VLKCSLATAVLTENAKPCDELRNVLTNCSAVLEAVNVSMKCNVDKQQKAQLCFKASSCRFDKVL